MRRGCRISFLQGTAGSHSQSHLNVQLPVPFYRCRHYTSHSSGNDPILSVPGCSIYSLGAGSRSSPLFTNVSWTVRPQEAWTVLSARGTSAKTSLLRALTGHLKIHPPPPPPGGLFPFLHGRDSHKLVSLVSFAHRPRAAGSSFVDFTARYGAVREEDKVTLIEAFFPELARPLHTLAVPDYHAHPQENVVELSSSAEQEARQQLFEDLIDKLDLRKFLHLPIIALSNGQTRKARILKALLEQPELLILDEPLTGLDVATRGLVLEMLYNLHTTTKGPHIILGSRIQDPIPDWTTHIALIKPDGTVNTGTKEMILASDSFNIARKKWHDSQHIQKDKSQVNEEKPAVVDLNRISVTYGERQVLKNITWTIRQNSRWHLRGANGAGKTTLMAMITGDHPQSYTQSSKLTLFSRPRSKWPTAQIHCRIGRVSPELHNAFPRRRGMTVWEAIGTAFDGGFVPRGKRRVGLTEDGKELEEGGETERWRLSRMWHVLEGLGPSSWQGESKNDIDKRLLEDFASRSFADLSSGEQSVVLLMRALVAQPPLVLLDEAWSGMDEGMVEAARRYLRTGGGLNESQACVVITHWEDEVPWDWEDGVRRFQLVDGEGTEILRPE